MTKARKSSIATNHAAIESVEALAISQGQTLGPVRAGSHLAEFPSRDARRRQHPRHGEQPENAGAGPQGPRL